MWLNFTNFAVRNRFYYPLWTHNYLIGTRVKVCEIAEGKRTYFIIVKQNNNCYDKSRHRQRNCQDNWH